MNSYISKKFYRQAFGFSLLELAIALSILAVLAGGFLKGRELLQSSRAQSVIDQLQGIETALAAFETRYSSLPGDFASSGVLPGTVGNGSGTIDSATERGAVFSHLAGAGLIKGTFIAASVTDTCPKTTCPANAFGGTLILGTGNNRLGGDTESEVLELSTGPLIPAKQLAEMDRKIDDGNPRTGNFRASSAQIYGNCVSEIGWNETGNVKNCMGVYLIQ